MLHMTFEDSKGRKWERVNATRARNAFMRGDAVTMCPRNLRPFGFWNPQSTVTRDDETHTWELQNYGPAGVWELLVNGFTAYNCTDNETGRYPSFYLLQQA